MKKLYFLLSMCIVSLASSAITVNINSTGATGSYETGYVNTTTKTDGNILVNSTAPRRGYAVFNLSSLPAGSTISSVSLRFNFTSSSGTVTTDACSISGYAADFSTLAASGVISDIGTAITSPFNSTNWGASTTGAQDLLPFNSSGISFIQAHVDSIVSICFVVSSGTNTYTITGEGGTTLTQPQLQINYTCAGLSLTATASPNPACTGSTISLTGTASGATRYSWSGPGSFTSTSLSTSTTASAAAVGIYTLTAYTASGCYMPATTASVTLTTTAPSITRSGLLCPGGGTQQLSDVASGGTWSIASTAVAAINASTGIVTGSVPGTATVTYVTPAGCNTSTVVTVNSFPPAISGSANICSGGMAAYTDAALSGTWSVSNTLLATIGSSSGDLSTYIPGLDTVILTPSAGGCPAFFSVSINGGPGAIGGTLATCPGATTALSDPSGGGTWSSITTSVAVVNPASGVVTGVAPGTAQIIYANGCGAPDTATLVVNTLPLPIGGTAQICIDSVTSLTDATPFGSWSVAALSNATVSRTGIVTGIATGTAIITYTALDACSSYVTVTIDLGPTNISGASNVCQGLTTTLLNGASGGAWSSSDLAVATVNPGGTVTGVSFGDINITYTVAPGCYATFPFTVDPVAPVLGRDSVCLGLNTFLTNIVGGGAWTSSNPVVATVDADSGKVTGRAVGSVTISYTLPTGCRSVANMNVIAFPSAITGAFSACPGTTASLADATSGGAWISANPAVASVGSTGIVTGISADTVSVSYSIQPGCVVYQVVTINPLPAAIIGDIRVCPQTTDSLTDATPGGHWTTTTPSLATVVDTSGVVHTIAQGSAVIVYTLPTGCMRTKTVSIDPLPVPTVTYNAFTETLLASIGDYLSYQWYDSIQGMIPGATSPSLAALYNEYYYVVVTDTNGCKGASALYHFNLAELGTGNVSANSSIRIYPNPASAALYIDAPEKVRVVITSTDGRTVIQADDPKEINLSGLSDAMYLISVFDEQGKMLTTQKLIKE